MSNLNLLYKRANPKIFIKYNLSMFSPTVEVFHTWFLSQKIESIET